MTNDAKELERKIAELRVSFTGKLESKLAEIKTARGELDKASSIPEAEAALITLHLLTHKLAGSAATFGVPEIGRISLEIEAITEKLEPSETYQPVSDKQLMKVNELIGELEKAITTDFKPAKDEG